MAGSAETLIAILFLGIALQTATSGCSLSSSTGNEAPSGRIDARLAALMGDGIAAVQIDVSSNGAVIASKKVQSLGDVDGGGTGIPEADALFVLAPGVYQVVATALGPDGNVIEACQPATGNAEVVAGLTTEITLTLPCTSTPSGGLDVVVKTSEAPTITDLAIAPSKFTETCAPVTMTVTATDPKGEPLTYTWTLVSSPPQTVTAKVTAPTEDLVPDGASAQFFTDLAGDYTLKVDVANTDGREASLTFPLHVIQGDTTFCNPTFDELNAWVPSGPPVPGLVYSDRAHIMPTNPLADPCELIHHDDNPTIVAPDVIPVMWGSTVPTAPAQDVTAMYTDLLETASYSPYLAALALEYQTGSSGTVTLPSGSTTGFLIAPTNGTPTGGITMVSSADVQRELTTQINAGIIPAPAGPRVKTIYAVYFPTTVTLTLFIDGALRSSCDVFLAYHSPLRVNGVDAAFMAIPMECAGGDPHGMEPAASHELIETLTDPLVSTWFVDEMGNFPLCRSGSEVGDLCAGTNCSLGSYNVQEIWSNATQTCVCPQAAMSSELRVQLTNVNFHTTGFNVFNHDPHFQTVNPGSDLYDCFPGQPPIVKQLGCFSTGDPFSPSGVTGFYAKVSCFSSPPNGIQGSVEFDITNVCTNSQPVPIQDTEFLAHATNPVPVATPLVFSASPGMPFSSTPMASCASNQFMNPGGCSCPMPAPNNDECQRALNVCYRGNDGTTGDSCSRQEFGADVTATVMP
jgi:hypothetical protein